MPSQFDCNPKNLIQIRLSRPSLTPAPRSNLVSRRYLSPHKNSALCHKLGINSTLIDKNHYEHEGSLELLFPRFAVFINCQAPAHIQVIVMLQSEVETLKHNSVFFYWAETIILGVQVDHFHTCITSILFELLTESIHHSLSLIWSNGQVFPLFFCDTIHLWAPPPQYRLPSQCIIRIESKDRK